MKKFWKFFSSMKFAVILLVILIISCVFGSFITQNQTLSWYTEHYSERVAAAIIALHLDDVFHSVWFLVIAGVLCLNLILCNLTRIRPIIDKIRRAGKAPERFEGYLKISGVEDPEDVFEKMHFPKPAADETEDGEKRLFASKNRAGLFGAWICHLGILLLIVGFVLGQLTHREYTVYGVAGETKTVGDTGLFLEINDFQVELRDDDTVSEYRSRITVYSAKDPENRASSEVTVNHPADLYGYRFYQNSTGYAATVKVVKEDALLQENVIAAGEGVRIEEKPMLTVFLQAFYPDLFMTSEGPKTASGKMDNPAYLYSLYYGEDLLGMNVLKEGEEIRVDDYVITFSDPENYTLLQVKKDSFTWMALMGGLIILIGLVLAFYLQQENLAAVREDDGTWTVYGRSGKGSVIFKERLEIAAGKPAESEE